MFGICSVVGEVLTGKVTFGCQCLQFCSALCMSSTAFVIPSTTILSAQQGRAVTISEKGYHEYMA